MLTSAVSMNTSAAALETHVAFYVSNSKSRFPTFVDSAKKLARGEPVFGAVVSSMERSETMRGGLNDG